MGSLSPLLAFAMSVRVGGGLWWWVWAMGTAMGAMGAGFLGWAAHHALRHKVREEDERGREDLEMERLGF